MNKIKILVTFICFVTIAVQAAELSLYQHAVMPSGPLEGERLDTTKLRSLVLLNDNNNITPEPLSKNHGYIANISHDGKFYVGRIAYNSPQNVSFIFEKFTNQQGGHADLVYELSKEAPLELLYEIKEIGIGSGYKLVKLANTIKLDHVLLTAELVKAFGDESTFRKGGLENKFAIAYRMTSIPQRLIGPVVEEGRVTTVYDIPFDTKETRASFWETVQEQSKIGMSENYNLILNNCITSAVKGLVNGLSSEGEKRANLELTLIMQKIVRLSRQDLSDAEMKSLFAEYTKLLGAKQSIKATPIMERAFFTEWLTQEQIEAVKSFSCRRLFY